ncbi:hypothetical protein ACFL7D_08025 [candidate division KSB1 bacterium]
MNKLSEISLFSNMIFLFIQIRKILFSGKFYIFLFFAILWECIMIFIAHYLAKESMPIEPAFFVMNMIPMMVLAWYLSMSMVTSERDNLTIESLFTVPGSQYKVWMYKITVQFITLFFVQVLLSLITFYFMIDFEIEVMIIHSFIPVFFAANLNFFLSTLMKNGYAAGICTLAVLLILISSAAFEESAWNFYIIPFNRPGNLDIDVWNQRLIYNKIGVFLLGSLFMYFGLNKLRKREPFIS